MIDINHIIKLYQGGAKSAAARGDMVRAQGYGERARMWIQILEQQGELEDGRQSAFHICKAA